MGCNRSKPGFAPLPRDGIGGMGITNFESVFINGVKYDTPYQYTRVKNLNQLWTTFGIKLNEEEIEIIINGIEIKLQQNNGNILIDGQTYEACISLQNNMRELHLDIKNGN